MSDSTGIAGVDTAIAWAVGMSAIIGLLAMAVRGIRGLAKDVRPISLMMKDWNGEPGRPGVPPRPGVMERIGGLEEDLGDVRVRVGGLERHVGRMLLDGSEGEAEGGLLGAGRRSAG